MEKLMISIKGAKNQLRPKNAAGLTSAEAGELMILNLSLLFGIKSKITTDDALGHVFRAFGY